MANVNFEISGYVEKVIEAMIKKGYAKTRTEAIRLALFEFDQLYALTDETLYGIAAERILARVKSGKEKTGKFSLSELD